jgi:hypothetical protein
VCNPEIITIEHEIAADGKVTRDVLSDSVRMWLALGVASAAAALYNHFLIQASLPDLLGVWAFSTAIAFLPSVGVTPDPHEIMGARRS